MTGNERWWQKMNGVNRKLWEVHNIVKLSKGQLNFGLVASNFLTSAYIAGVPSIKHHSHQSTVIYIALKYILCVHIIKKQWRNEQWLLKMKIGNTGGIQNIVELNKRKLNFELVFSSFLTSAYIAAFPQQHQMIVVYFCKYYTKLDFVNNKIVREKNDDYRTWKVITGNEQWYQKMTSDDRKRTMMRGNERWWQELSGDDTKWMEWQEMNGDGRKWTVITANER